MDKCKRDLDCVRCHGDGTVIQGEFDCPDCTNGKQCAGGVPDITEKRRGLDILVLETCHVCGLEIPREVLNG